MTDILLSSVRGSDIRSRNLQGAAFDGSGIAVYSNSNNLESVGVSTANVLKNVISITGSGWLLSVGVKNSSSSTATASNTFRGVLTIDGISVVDLTGVNAQTAASVGLVLLGGVSVPSSLQPVPVPVRFETGFSLNVTSSIDRSAAPFLGYQVKYFLD